MPNLSNNLFGDGPANSILDSPSAPSAPIVPPVEEEEPEMREFGDVNATRKAIYDNVFQAAAEMQPSVGKMHTLRLINPVWGDPENFSKRQRKEAVLAGRSMGRRLRGTWQLTDNETGEVVDQRDQVVARAPYVTHSGTFVHNGNEYAIKNQQRLRAGIFVREKDNGELEAHANVLANGPSHRYFIDPAQGVFYIRMGQAKIPLMPLVRAMGATDKDLREAWGPEIHAANYQKNDSGALKKLQEKLLRGREGGVKELVEAYQKMELDPEVTGRTLGVPYENLSLEAIMATTKKLLAVGRKEAEVDDRDHLAYQTFLGPEDLIAERLRKDRGGLRRQLMWKASLRGNLQNMPSSALQDQIDAAMLESGLGQALEEINPAEIFDKQTQISRMGEGGIPSLVAVPDEARGVQPSHLGFMDPLRTPESMRVGVDVHIARNARKGKNGKMYSQFRDLKTGKDVWRTPQQMADQVVTFPGALRQTSRPPAGMLASAAAALQRTKEGRPTAQDAQTLQALKDFKEVPLVRVPAMRRGRIQWVLRDEVDLELPAFENAFSPLGNMVPLKSMVKGQRVAMASRMLTQALPLTEPEAPLVQSGVPGSGGTTSFEDEYGKHMGAERADKGGRVLAMDDDRIIVQYDDGSREEVELYNNHPHNRKTYIHQTSVVKPGQRFAAGDLLARSNYTDQEGSTALGLNARVAYVPWGGKNFEDAIVVSEGMAKRLTSEHMYQHDLTTNENTRTGKNNYISLFPGKYDRDTLLNLDDDGLVKVGTEVNYGDPLILAAEQRSRALNKVHKKRQAGFLDKTVTWKHHDVGIVTDVVKSKRGPVVLVKSSQEMRVGDKMCYDPATSLLTRSGWKPVAEITADDELATLNAETGELEYHHPTHIHNFDHAGDMYYLNTKHLNMLVTMEHRLWVARPGEEYRAVTAGEFYNSKGEWRFKKDCTWRGAERTWMTFSEYIAHNSRDNTLPTEVPMDDWLEFLGYYLAEGRVTRTTSGGYQTQISQFKSSLAWEKIEDTLLRIGLRYTYRDAEKRFEINSKQLYGILEPLGDTYSKYVPGYAQELCPRQLLILFDAYMDGDGHRGACHEFSSSSYRLAEDMQVICLKLGWCVTLKSVDRTDNFQKKPHWRGRVNRRHLRPWWKKSRVAQYESVEEKVVQYDGKVHCITVPNHIVYCKREDKTYWSLNSGRYG